jgi:hypothetical protein
MDGHPMQSRSRCDLLCVGRKLLRQSTASATTVCALDVVAYWALFEVDSFYWYVYCQTVRLYQVDVLEKNKIKMDGHARSAKRA